METNRITIKVDYREKPSGIIELLRAQGIEADICVLKYGDYIVNGMIVIERKTASDFVRSIISGRLFKQAGFLTKRALNSLVIIEGNPFKTGIDIHKNAVLGAFVSVAAVFGIPILFSGSKTATADILRMIGAQLASTRMIRFRFHPKLRSIRSRQLYLLQGLPGIGPYRAKALLEHFGSVLLVFNATVGEIASIKGFGSVLAAKMMSVLHAREGRNGNSPV